MLILWVYTPCKTGGINRRFGGWLSRRWRQ